MHARSRADLWRSRLRCANRIDPGMCRGRLDRHRRCLCEGSSAGTGAPLQTIPELETTARLLAVLLDSGRNVINEHQVPFDEQEKPERDFTPDSVLSDNCSMSFVVAPVLDLRDLEAARIPARAKKLLKELVLVSRQVACRSPIRDQSTRWRAVHEFIPAIFGSAGVDPIHSTNTRAAEADGAGASQSPQRTGRC